MQMKLFVPVAVAAVIMGTGMGLAFAAPASGFDNAQANVPTGFAISQENRVAVADLGALRDHTRVQLRGRLTDWLHDEIYEFTDERGDRVCVHLDDDENWSHIRKDELIDIDGKLFKGRRQGRQHVDVWRAAPVAP